jgi:hypothetical protein
MPPSDKDRAVCRSKYSYETRHRAKRCARKVKASSDKPGVLLRPYQCRVCGLWHLTKNLPRVADREYVA